MSQDNRLRTTKKPAPYEAHSMGVCEKWSVINVKFETIVKSSKTKKKLNQSIISL